MPSHVIYPRPPALGPIGAISVLLGTSPIGSYVWGFYLGRRVHPLTSLSIEYSPMGLDLKLAKRSLEMP